MSSATRHFFLIEGADPADRERVARRLRMEFDASEASEVPPAGDRTDLDWVSFDAPLAAARLASFREHATRLERLDSRVRIHLLALDDEAGAILARRTPGRGRIPAGREVFLEAVGTLDSFGTSAPSGQRAYPASKSGSDADSETDTDADDALDALLALPEIRLMLSNA